MNSDVLERLLASILARRLVVVYGAGLSMGKPSSAPSAKEVAQFCFDQYVVSTGAALDASLRDDLEKLADYFHDRRTLESVFITHLVPWGRFTRPPNAGHAAIADFLWTGAAIAALSGNFDNMVERHGYGCGADLHASLDGAEASSRVPFHSPLLKLHGCHTRDPNTTVWTKKQLADDVIAIRIQSSRAWMEANLQNKDLLIVGFWSDWSYLNEVLGRALVGVNPTSITVIDPSTSDELEAKAPDLWAIAHGFGVTFNHVQEKAEDAIEQLNSEFSKVYLKKMLLAGKAAAEAVRGTASNMAWFDPPDLTAEELYGLRRDAEGVPSTQPARLREPMGGEVLGMFHLLLISAGAAANANGYQLDGKQIRVINGAQTLLTTLQKTFKDEPPLVSNADIVVAVGATDLPYPGNVVRKGMPGGVMRGAVTGEWLDLASARSRLGI